jgi:hypothetical protein
LKVLPTKILLRTVGGKEVAVAAGIETFLLLFSLRRLIVRGTPLVGTLPTRILPAAKRTTQVPPTCVAGMGEKPDPAVTAANEAIAKLGMGLHHRVQRGLILPNTRPGAVVLVPIYAKRENLLDANDKKARLSAIMERVFCTPSSYFIEAKASRGRARFFCANQVNTCKTHRYAPSVPYRFPRPFRLSSQRRVADRQIPKRLLERSKPILLSK